MFTFHLCNDFGLKTISSNIFLKDFDLPTVRYVKKTFYSLKELLFTRDDTYHFFMPIAPDVNAVYLTITQEKQREHDQHQISQTCPRQMRNHTTLFIEEQL